MEIQKLQVKVYADTGDAFAQADLIPVFHDWIREKRIEGELLVDVHDYSHVHHGPGVLLVGREANYSLDESDGRIGLHFYRKQPADGPVAERLKSALHSALRACRLLEDEPRLKGALKFRGHELTVGVNDRLVPNSDETLEALRPDLEAVLAELYDGASAELTRDQEPRRRFAVDVRAPAPCDVTTLLGRLE